MYQLVHLTSDSNNKKLLFLEVDSAREMLKKSLVETKELYENDKCDVLITRDQLNINNSDKEVVRLIAVNCDNLDDAEHIWFIDKILY